jgi:hypothetical protein
MCQMTVSPSFIPVFASAAHFPVTFCIMAVKICWLSRMRNKKEINKIHSRGRRRCWALSRCFSIINKRQHTVKQFVDLSLHYYNKFLFYFILFNYNLTQFKWYRINDYHAVIYVTFLPVLTGSYALLPN